MKVWIDTVTGTWGDTVGLVVVDLDAVAAEDVAAGEKPGHDAHSLLAALADMSDSDVNRFGVQYGKPAVTR